MCTIFSYFEFTAVRLHPHDSLKHSEPDGGLVKSHNSTGTDICHSSFIRSRLYKKKVLFLRSDDIKNVVIWCTDEYMCICTDTVIIMYSKNEGKKSENLRKGENILWFNCLENYPVKIKHAWSSRLSSHFLNNRGRDTTFHPEVLKLFFPKHLCSFPSIVYWSLVLHWQHISWFQKPGNAC